MRAAVIEPLRTPVQDLELLGAEIHIALADPCRQADRLDCHYGAHSLVVTRLMMWPENLHCGPEKHGNHDKDGDNRAVKMAAGKIKQISYQ